MVLAQFSVGVVGALVWWWFGTNRDALGALAGGSIGAASSLYFALRMGTAAGSASAGPAFARFLTGWLVKIVVAVGLLWAVARYAPDAVGAMVSTFIPAVLVYVFIGQGFDGKE